MVAITRSKTAVRRAPPRRTKDKSFTPSALPAQVAKSNNKSAVSSVPASAPRGKKSSTVAKQKRRPNRVKAAADAYKKSLAKARANLDTGRMRSMPNLWVAVGNLDPGVSQGRLVAHFKSFGKVKSVSIRYSTTGADAYTYAIIEYHTHSEAVDALALNGTRVPGSEFELIVDLDLNALTTIPSAEQVEEFRSRSSASEAGSGSQSSQQIVETKIWLDRLDVQRRIQRARGKTHRWAGVDFTVVHE
ncbi:hypothetical protein FB45DRAFT_872805 [Roridomyces roridus]|uniref:RRM domain-containing protein n=1 Tax=Roridomyces roridus TaxID=1738132 RepID=A0AAD7BD00_9AGAR|nr:hypothetical protein FB45DRAFT_872805 [Roridomyces roridus]